MTFFAGDAPALDRRTLLDVPANRSDVFGAAFEGAFSTNPSTSLLRLEQLNEQEQGRAVVSGPESYLAPNAGRLDPETPLISAQQARDKVQAAGLDLKIPDQGIRQGALDILIERQQAQLAREQIMARANGGYLPTQIAAGLSASLLDPLNIASAFVPVVGEARYARLLAGATSPLGRAGVRAGVGALEGSVGAAILEPLPLLAAQADQTEYGLSDSFANIAFGAALGGGLHSIGGAVSDALRRRISAEVSARPEDVAVGAGPAQALPDAAPTARLRDLGRVFEDDPDTGLRMSLQRGIEADDAAIMQSARQQAISEIRPTLAGERVGNVVDLRAERAALVKQDDSLDATYRDRAKEFQAQRMSRKQAERAARDSIAAEREQIRTRAAEIDTQLELNRAGEFQRADRNMLDRGEAPERLSTQIEARAMQIAEGFRQRPLGLAVRTAREVAQDADWRMRGNAMRAAVSQAMSGRDIDVAKLFELEDPAKAASALEYIKRPQGPRVDPEGVAESARVDSLPRELDDLEDARAQLAEDEAVAREILDQLPEEQRAEVEALGRDEMALADAEAEKAEKYAKAYRAAAICELGRG